MAIYINRSVKCNCRDFLQNLLYLHGGDFVYDLNTVLPSLKIIIVAIMVVVLAVKGIIMIIIITILLLTVQD